MDFRDIGFAIKSLLYVVMQKVILNFSTYSAFSKYSVIGKVVIN